MKTLILIRGIPGSGKTTFGEYIAGYVHSADNYMLDSYGDYAFDSSKIADCHKCCWKAVLNDMENECPQITVANTFTKDWEMAQYYDLAEKHSYRVFSIIVENRHCGNSIHDVPQSTIDKMEQRFSIHL